VTDTQDAVLAQSFARARIVSSVQLVLSLLGASVRAMRP